MMRMELKMDGRFYLYSKDRGEYFIACGTHMEPGMDERKYWHWTPYIHGAKGYDTIKQARAMQRKLLPRYHAVIVDAKGRLRA